MYNGEPYLAQAVDSLLAQTFTDFTLIISDNGSSDGTEAMGRAYAGRDARVAYHRSDVNRGAAWNFNRVVALAASPYFKWAAYDDWCAPTFAARCIELLDRTPQAIVAYPQSYVVDGDGTITGTYREPADATSPQPHRRFHAVVRNSGYCHMQFGVMRRAILQQTQLIGPYPASDTILLAELALRGQLHEVGEPLLYWRDHAGSSQRRSGSDEALAAFFDPRNAGTIRLRHARLLAGYLRTLARVPLPGAERLRCAAVIGAWTAYRLPLL
ncbi:MAG: glycosyltransferase family 2 protein, partial [Candidatus Binatia bacterium]